MEEILLFLLNNVYAFAIMTAVVLRAQIKSLWRSVALISFFVWRNFWYALFIAASAGFAIMSALGVEGSFALTEYASARFLPAVCIMILAFAFLIASSLLLQGISGEVKLCKRVYSVKNFNLRVKLNVSTFDKPLFVLLQ